jgi:hypothetical protein
MHSGRDIQRDIPDVSAEKSLVAATAASTASHKYDVATPTPTPNTASQLGILRGNRKHFQSPNNSRHRRPAPDKHIKPRSRQTVLWGSWSAFHWRAKTRMPALRLRLPRSQRGPRVSRRSARQQPVLRAEGEATPFNHPVATSHRTKHSMTYRPIAGTWRTMRTQQTNQGEWTS